jgi:hypothetical protein
MLVKKPIRYWLSRTTTVCEGRGQRSRSNCVFPRGRTHTRAIPRAFAAQSRFAVRLRWSTVPFASLWRHRHGAHVGVRRRQHLQRHNVGVAAARVIAGLRIDLGGACGAGFAVRNPRARGAGWTPGRAGILAALARVQGAWPPAPECPAGQTASALQVRSLSGEGAAFWTCPGAHVAHGVQALSRLPVAV